MGVTTITPTPIVQTGVVQTTAMAAVTTCGDRYRPVGTRDFIRFTNTSDGDCHAIFDNTAGGSDLNLTVAATTGDVTVAWYNSVTPVSVNDFIDTDGYINISYTGNSTDLESLSIGVFRLP